MTQRIPEQLVQGIRTQDGAGVNLVRVLGHTTTKTFDPILMLDSFDSKNPADYIAGFPLHPHRGIETVSYLCARHHDAPRYPGPSGNHLRWRCPVDVRGFGHRTRGRIPATNWMLGVQLWLNLPSNEKMCPPSYTGIESADIPEIPCGDGIVRVLAGTFGDTTGHLGAHLPWTITTSCCPQMAPQP